MGYRDILMKFAQYGIQKTSMADIAKAAGVSRQSIYNRFGSKENVLEWVLASIVDEMTSETTKVFEASKDKDPQKVILEYVESGLIDLIPVIHSTEHGASILGFGAQFVSGVYRDWEEEMRKELAKYLVTVGISSSLERANEQVYVLDLATTGIVFKSSSAEEFSRITECVIRVIFNRD